MTKKRKDHVIMVTVSAPADVPAATVRREVRHAINSAEGWAGGDMRARKVTAAPRWTPVIDAAAARAGHLPSKTPVRLERYNFVVAADLVLHPEQTIYMVKSDKPHPGGGKYSFIKDQDRHGRVTAYHNKAEASRLTLDEAESYIREISGHLMRPNSGAWIQSWRIEPV